MKRIILLLSIPALVFIQFGFKSVQEKSQEKSYKTKYAIIFVMDGARFSETFGEPNLAYIPRLGKEMAKEGVLFSGFMNMGVTHTSPGHTAMTTGVYQSLPNDGSELPKNPSFFQYYLKATGADKTDALIISSKGKLGVLANTKSKKWWNSYVPNYYCGLNGNGVDYVGDSFTWGKIEKIFSDTLFVPKLSLINLLAADVAGHQKDWEAYKKGIQDIDEYAYKLWKLIQNNPRLKNQTSLFITNDHGRHLDGRRSGFANHGDKCMGCRHIFMLAMGPDFKKNVVIEKGGELIDLSKTIAEMFHFDMPTSKGRVLTELFEQ